MLRSSIVERYQSHTKERWCQGDIFRDLNILQVNPDGSVEEFSFPYLLLINQDCDLQQFHYGKEKLKEKEPLNNYLPNALFVPAYPADQAREGSHIEALFGYRQLRITSDNWKRVKQNREARYHFFAGDPKRTIPDLLCDFMHVTSIPFNLFEIQAPTKYLATVNELFREDLSSRFSSYLSRIGLPVVI